jgi:hypothetical protein
MRSAQLSEAPYIRVKNWTKFQHYKHRRPPWIKLHRELLDDFAFNRLPLASRALAPCLWLLASESDDGSLPVSAQELAFRAHCSEDELLAAVNPLIEAGFLECSHDASELLAPRKQNVTTEIEKRQSRERDRVTDAPADAAPMAIVPQRGGWVGKVVDSWPGVVKAGHVGKVLSPVVKRYGAEAMLSGLTRWLEAGNAKFGPEVYARDAESWISGGGTRASPTPKEQKRRDVLEASILGGLKGDGTLGGDA